MSNVLQSLQRDGYAVVRNILTTEKCNEIALQIKKQSKGLPNMAHSNVVWDVRCLPEIKSIFKMLWNDDDLIVGFDGVGTRKKGTECDGLPWHVDQDGSHGDSICCYQSIIAIKPSSSLTGNICVLPKSHKHHRSLSQRLDDGSGGWEFLEVPEDDIIFKLSLSPYCPNLQSGDMFIWDSRTVHMVSKPIDLNTERMVVYMCMTPRSFAEEETLRLREHAYLNGIATTHWPHRFVDRGEEWGKPQCPKDAKRMELV